MNYSLIKVARDVLNKSAFVPSGDPSMGGAPPGGAPPTDPAMMGGMPPGMDPAMMGGMPPGGAPPMDPAMMGGAPPAPPAPSPIDPGMIQQIVADEVRKAMGAGGAGAAAGGGLKPKIDVNVELMQIKHMLAKLADALNVKIPAQDLVATPDKLMTMANGGDATSGAGGGAISAIKGITGLQGAGTPGGEKVGRDMQLSAQTVKDMLISPSIKQAEAAGQAMMLPLFQANNRASMVGAAIRGRR